jgi:hypothetical protein
MTRTMKTFTKNEKNGDTAKRFFKEVQKKIEPYIGLRKAVMKSKY